MEAYIYTYVNRETKKTYIGARCAYVGSCYDDLNIKYFSSSNDKEFRQDMADGKLEGQIVLVMNDENANKKIFEVEAKMIQAYWDKYGKENSYNHYAGGKFSTAGTHPNVGIHRSDETRAKLSAAHKGKHHNNETKAKISASGKGRHLSEETRSKMSAAKKGKTFSYEHRKKLSAVHKCKTFSEETRKKLSAVHKGKTFSDEHRKKLSDALKGNNKKKFNYLTEDGSVVMMDKGNASRYHPNWAKLD